MKTAKHFTTIDQIWEHLDGLGFFHMDLSLTRMETALSRLGLSRPPFVVAQIVGTNGKGSTAAMLALQAVGAAAGNMIAIHNVVAASATVGLLGREGATLRKTALPTLYYLLVTGLIGLALMYSFHISDALLQLK